MPADPNILAARSAHDSRLFDTLLKEHHPRVYRFAFRLTGSRPDAEDLAQEAFVRAHTAFDRYDRARPFEQWILRITYRLFIDRLRRRKHPQTYSLDEIQETANAESRFSREIPDERANPEAMLMEMALDERLEKALEGMPAVFRQAILMADVEDMSYDEIAAAMSCSAGTVRSRIHRGRTHLRKALRGLKHLVQSAALLFAPALVSAVDFA
jgi:RNA polymerase sigma-70 factor (ECF subfamily)